jgi:CubicO group peptidase (beta-lactamase class C family)
MEDWGRSKCSERNIVFRASRIIALGIKPTIASAEVDFLLRKFSPTPMAPNNFERLPVKLGLLVCSAISLCILSRVARADGIDDLMRHAVEKAHIPGASVAIVRDGKVVRISSYGLASAEYNVAVSPETPFQLASASKMYTGALLMRMVEQHEIGLDDPVTKYLPDAPVAWSRITIRNLAGHSAGIDAVQVDSNVTAAKDVVELAYKAKILTPPGERANYAGTDFTILQYILEKISGKPFEGLIQEKLFDPSGMRCTAFDEAEEHGPQRFAHDIAGRAEYYRWIDTFNQRRWFLYTKYAYAAGGAYSCVKDTAEFIARIDARTLLSSISVQTMETPETLLDGSHSQYGIGWVVGTYRGHRWVGHSGGPAFSDVMYFPDDHLGIVVLTNQQKLHPVLAPLIADQFLATPPAYSESGLSDSNPALTLRIRKLLEGAAAGHVDPSLFAPAIREDYASDFSDVGPSWFGLFDPLRRIVLVSDSTSADGTRTRRYRVFFGDHAQGFTINYDAEGKIAGFDSGGD